ncbi:hypothetical protein NFI96_016328 [Prochilodus magdalenae]|nr:hypothetical protein NFI96_016328 [Prochilodus magdalenae]
MSDQLMKVRVELIAGVSEALLKDLIDGLRATDPPVLTGREANHILQANQVQEDRVGELVDMVHKKGQMASLLMISILEEKDKHLAAKLGLGTETDISGELPLSLARPISMGSWAGGTRYCEAEKWEMWCHLNQIRLSSFMES